VTNTAEPVPFMLLGSRRAAGPKSSPRGMGILGEQLTEMGPQTGKKGAQSTTYPSAPPTCPRTPMNCSFALETDICPREGVSSHYPQTGHYLQRLMRKRELRCCDDQPISCLTRKAELVSGIGISLL